MEGIQGTLGEDLGASRGYLETTWGHVEAPRGYLGSTWGWPGGTWRPLGGTDGPPWGEEPPRNQKDSVTAPPNWVPQGGQRLQIWVPFITFHTKLSNTHRFFIVLPP